MAAESPAPENSSNWRIRIAKRPPAQTTNRNQVPGAQNAWSPTRSCCRSGRGLGEGRPDHPVTGRQWRGAAGSAAWMRLVVLLPGRAGLLPLVPGGFSAGDCTGCQWPSGRVAEVLVSAVHPAGQGCPGSAALRSGWRLGAAPCNAGSSERPAAGTPRCPGARTLTWRITGGWAGA